jgi:four helix bundle protein
MMKGDDISERLLEFAVRVLRLIQALPNTLAGRHVSGQLLRCGTSAGSNYEEARGGESRADFIHKLGIAWKEMRESWYWLRVIYRSELIKPSLVEKLVQESDELSRILSRSQTTAKQRKINKGERE